MEQKILVYQGFRAPSEDESERVRFADYCVRLEDWQKRMNENPSLLDSGPTIYGMKPPNMERIRMYDILKEFVKEEGEDVELLEQVGEGANGIVAGLLGLEEVSFRDKQDEIERLLLSEEEDSEIDDPDDSDDIFRSEVGLYDEESYSNRLEGMLIDNRSTHGREDKVEYNKLYKICNDIESEFKNLHSLKSRHIVKALSYKKFKGYDILELEHIKGKTLRGTLRSDELHRSRGVFSKIYAFQDKYAFAYSWQILRGLIELARIGKNHFDLHPGNIVINPNEVQSKIIDLGSTDNISDGQPARNRPYGGIDIISYGQIVCRMASGWNLFNNGLITYTGDPNVKGGIKIARDDAFNNPDSLESYFKKLDKIPMHSFFRHVVKTCLSSDPNNANSLDTYSKLDQGFMSQAQKIENVQLELNDEIRVFSYDSFMKEFISEPEK